ncbi:MAG: hypothetical protein WC946_11420 [Bacteroidales bacterium]
MYTGHSIPFCNDNRYRAERLDLTQDGMIENNLRRYDGMVKFWLKLGTNYASMEKRENSVDEQMID